MSVPTHVALICDGNGRWAKARLLPVSLGHNQGMKRIEDSIELAREIGIKYLTFYAFSTENWKRSEEEVNHLLSLVEKFYYKKRDLFHKHQIRFVLLGSRTNIPANILDIFDRFSEETKDYQELVVNIAFNYGGQLEIVEAVNEIIASGKDSITVEEFPNYLYTKDQPPVDLLIRTSGEERISNFLLWQIAYAELVFVKKLWPDFTKEEFSKAIAEYNNRSRRFGGR